MLLLVFYPELPSTDSFNEVPLSGKLSRHGRLVKALQHHTMQPNALPDI